jgi:hypothetical protein
MGDVTLKLTAAEALVLFEWLNRVDDAGTLRFEHPSEQTVLWALEAMLESALSEPFSPEYRQLLTRAREQVGEGKAGG